MAPVKSKNRSSVLKHFLAIIQMPRMQSSSGQCCLCVVGVFLFLFGIIMIAMGVCMLLNYGLFDSELLPEEFKSDEGKRVIGIILTSTGFASAIISILVSSYYLCTRSKQHTIGPTELLKIPDSSRKTPEPRRTTDKSKVRGEELSKPSHAASMHSNPVPTSRMRKKHKRHKMALVQKSRLEGIQEADAKSTISRKPSEVDMERLRELENDSGDNTPSVSGPNESSDYYNKGMPDITSADGRSQVEYKLSQFALGSQGSFNSDKINVREANEYHDNSSTESGYTDSVNTSSMDKHEFEQQYGNLVA